MPDPAPAPVPAPPRRTPVAARVPTPATRPTTLLRARRPATPARGADAEAPSPGFWGRLRELLRASAER